MARQPGNLKTPGDARPQETIHAVCMPTWHRSFHNTILYHMRNAQHKESRQDKCKTGRRERLQGLSLWKRVAQHGFAFGVDSMGNRYLEACPLDYQDEQPCEFRLVDKPWFVADWTHS